MKTYSTHLIDNTKYCKKHNCVYSSACPHCSKEKKAKRISEDQKHTESKKVKENGKWKS